MMSDVSLEHFCRVFLLMLKVVKHIHFLWYQTSPFDLRTRMILCLPGDWIFGFGDYWQCLLTLLYCRLSSAVHPWPSGVGRKGVYCLHEQGWLVTSFLQKMLWVPGAARVSLHQQRGDPGRSPWNCVPVTLLGASYTLSLTSIPNNRETNPGQQPAAALTALIFLLALTFRALKNLSYTLAKPQK